jgi:DNA-binding transcriptional MerR regulator
MTTSPKHQELLSAAAVSDLLGVDQQSVQSWVADGLLPVQMRDTDGQALFRPRDLEPLLVGLVC